MIRLLPEDLERLQHTGPAVQGSRKNDGAPKPDHVPADPTPQREKR